jgi:hypothetical protein
MKNITDRQIYWDDLPFVAIVAALDDAVIQCAIMDEEGRQRAHLFMMRDGLLALTEIDLKSDIEPSNDLLLAIARVQVAHLKACREGRAIV